LPIPIPDKANLPPELIRTNRFLLWFAGERDGKPTKLPAAPWVSGHWNQIDGTDSVNWTTFDKALEYTKQKEGYGIGVALGDGILGIDLDHCIDDAGNVSEFASRIVYRAASYTELSPSGKGVHILMRGKGQVKSKELEIYDWGRFFTLTGRRYKESPLKLHRHDELIDELIREAGAGRPKFNVEEVINGVGKGDRHPQGIRYATYLIGVKKLDPLTALHEMKSWNALNQPPMQERDLVRMVKNAVRYVRKSNAVESEEIDKELEDFDVYEDFVEFFGKEIKEDPRIIEMIFPKLISAYTPDPANLGIEAPTSEGKTYAVVKIAKYFPKGDVWLLGGLSPKALIHQRGRMIGDNDEPLEPILNALNVEEVVAKQTKDPIKIAEIKQRRAEIMAKCRYLIELTGKIIIMLEAPSLETWEMLRPVLSHDAPETTYKFVDKQSMRTYTVVIRGWPVFIYCKAGRGREDIIWDQIQSRFTTISPKMNATKYREAVKLTAMKKGLPTTIYKQKLGMDEEDDIRRYIESIKKRLLDITAKAIKSSGDYDANIFWIPFYNQIGAKFPANIGRHMRDSNRFLQDMQLSAAVNVFSRPILMLKDAENIIVVKRDYDRAVEHYFGSGGDEVLTGLPGNILSFFKDIIVPLWKEKNPNPGLTVREIVDATRGARHTIKSAKTLNKHYLPVLEEAGLLTSDPDPDDKRRLKWTVLTEEITEEEIGAISSRNEKEPIFSEEAFNEAYSEVAGIDAQLCYKQTTNPTTTDLKGFYEKFFVCFMPKEASIVPEAQLGANDGSSDKKGDIPQTEVKAPIIDVGTVEPQTPLSTALSIIADLARTEGKTIKTVRYLAKCTEAGVDEKIARMLIDDLKSRGKITGLDADWFEVP
jgi:hypothetical protein